MAKGLVGGIPAALVEMLVEEGFGGVSLDEGDSSRSIASSQL